MIATKTLFLIPGFYQKATDHCYRWLTKYLKSKGYDVIAVPVHWKNRTMTDYVRDFEKFFLQRMGTKNYFLGFSYGAVIAFMTTSRLGPEKVYLCSLSPDFKEDASSIKSYELKLIGKKRFADVKTRSAKKIAKELKIPSVLFYGEVEGKKYPQLKKRVEETVKLSSRTKLVIVKDAPHKIDHPEYIKAIKREI